MWFFLFVHLLNVGFWYNSTDFYGTLSPRRAVPDATDRLRGNEHHQLSDVSPEPGHHYGGAPTAHPPVVGDPAVPLCPVWVRGHARGGTGRRPGGRGPGAA